MHQKYKPYSTSILSTALIAREGTDDGNNNSNTNNGSTGNNDAAVAEAARRAEAEARAAAAEAEVQRRIDAAVKGLKDKNNELLGTQKALKEKLGQFDGLDPEKARKLVQDFENDEDLKLINEGKKDVVIQKHTERMRSEYQNQLEAERKARKDAEAVADSFRQHVLDNQIRSVATGLHKGAVEDALLHARQIFQLDAKGNAVALDAEGRPKVGKDGQTPLSPAEWIESMKESKPHWFPMNTSGSGSGNASPASGNTNTIKRADFDRKTPAEQAALAKSGTKIVD